MEARDVHLDVDAGFHPLHSGIQALPLPLPDFGIDPNLVRLQNAFIDCWARMAAAFAMDRAMGRVHSLIYISPIPIDSRTVAMRLATTECAVEAHVENLVTWGLVRVVDQGEDGRPRFEAELDPWSWFLRTLRERHRREFAPLQRSVRDVLELARRLHSVNANGELGESLVRIERFTRFIEEVSRLIDAFVNLGAKPMAMVLKTVAKLMPRSARF
jgi:DNA-binding transcriptional regulator GbsR (MarR family)